MNKYVIIVAGGKGKRMRSETPKQFLQVAGKPLLMHTINKFRDYHFDIRIILVLPAPFIDFWKSLCKRFEFTTEHELVEGGKSRFHSVKNGLKKVEPSSLVAIHDGVRPLVSIETIHRVFDSAQEEGNAIPVVKISESLRQLNSNGSIPVSRQDYRLIQTPQAFHSEVIIEAYEQDYQDHFTDDATVIESQGISINFVDGNYENIKITRPADLTIAQALLK